MDDWKHDHLGNQIIILSNQVKHYLHQAAEVEGISGSQSRILHYISEFSKKTEVYQKDVEEFFYLRRSTVTQTLQAMEKNGLIRRSSVARDARLKKLELTEAGQALEAKIHTRVMQMEQRLRESLTEEEITQFLSITDKLGAELTSLGAPEIKQAGEYPERHLACFPMIKRVSDMMQFVNVHIQFWKYRYVWNLEVLDVL